MVFIVDAFIQIPSSSFRKKQKNVENEEKTVDGLQKKAKENVNMDCFSLIEGQEKSGNF